MLTGLCSKKADKFICCAGDLTTGQAGHLCVIVPENANRNIDILLEVLLMSIEKKRKILPLPFTLSYLESNVYIKAEHWMIQKVSHPIGLCGTAHWHGAFSTHNPCNPFISFTH